LTVQKEEGMRMVLIVFACLVAALGTPSEVAEHIQVSEGTLAQWRHRGVGPKWVRCGRRIRYRWEDVERWITEQTGARRGAGKRTCPAA
jgi:predicted DNA-binding transcriptional regulator AlpA